MTWVIRICSAAVILDQLTKYFVRQSFYPGETMRVIGDFFHLTYYRNSGIAFGLLDGYPTAILAIGSCAIVFLFWLATRMAVTRWTRLAFGLVLGGAMGNWVDRVHSFFSGSGGVVDFLDFGLGGYRWPAFNIADLCISVGVGLLVLTSATEPAED